MDVMLHLTRLNARKDESGEEKESAGLKVLAGCDRSDAAGDLCVSGKRGPTHIVERYCDSERRWNSNFSEIGICILAQARHM
jgi:hypothetical protein